MCLGGRSPRSRLDNRPRRLVRPPIRMCHGREASDRRMPSPAPIEIRKREPSGEWKTIATPPTLAIARAMLRDFQSVMKAAELAIFVDGVKTE